MNTAAQNFKIQKYIALLSLGLFAVKVTAWYLTGSVAILTDALESIVNVIAGFMGLYSLYVSGKPKDSDHPYGHGKVEFITAAVEGLMIAIAGIIIIWEAILNLYEPHVIKQLDKGIYLVAVTAVLNYFAGWICVKKGSQNNSLALVSSGKHLISDTYTTLGIIIGLILLFITGISWIDSAVAVVFAIIILITGYKIIRSSIAGMMDEADEEMIREMVDLLNNNRKENWIDLHNLRIIKYGALIHIDCHLTVPWFFNVHEAHKEIDDLAGLVRGHFGDRVELFVHSDGCLDFSCAVCKKTTCQHRKSPFEKRVEWTIKNVASNNKHTVKTEN